jgi:hypothetical protein
MALRNLSPNNRSAAIRFLVLLAFMSAALSRNGDAQSTAPAPGRMLVDTIGIENIMSFPMHQQMLVFMRPLQEENRSRQQEVFDIFDQIVMPQAMLVFTADPVKEQIARYYDQNFSASEIRELITFFSTPVGKKFASKSSAMNDGLAPFAVRLLGTVTVQGAVRRGVEEVQKRGMSVPKPPAP